MKKPNVETFRKVVKNKGGNLTKVAETFKVGRCTVYSWINNDPSFKEAVQDERGALVDACVLSARLLAVGIPAIGEDGKFEGWIERPDPNMVRYILSTLGRKEGFGETDETEGVPTDIAHGIEIDKWIEEQVK